MTAHTNYPQPNGAAIPRSGGGNAAGSPAYDVLTNVFDCAQMLGVTVAAADTIEVLTIPAGTFVGHVFLEILTTQATITLAVGDAADPDGWLVAATLGVAGTITKSDGAFNTAGGKLYTADTPLKLLTAAATGSTFKVRVTALVAKLT